MEWLIVCVVIYLFTIAIGYPLTRWMFNGPKDPEDKSIRAETFMLFWPLILAGLVLCGLLLALETLYCSIVKS